MTWAAVAGLIVCAVIFTSFGIVIGYASEQIIKLRLELKRKQTANGAGRADPNLN